MIWVKLVLFDFILKISHISTSWNYFESFQGLFVLGFKLKMLKSA